MSFIFLVGQPELGSGAKAFLEEPSNTSLLQSAL